MFNLGFENQDNINEIKKGFEMFDVENKGQINPFELKETMEEMNLNDKNPFLYELISSLCSSKEIKSKDGLTSDEFILYLNEKISDTESKKGVETIFNVFSDLDNKIPMSKFYQITREVGDEEGGAEIRDLVEKSKTGGKEIGFNEFYDIMIAKNPINIYNQSSDNRSENENSYKITSKVDNNYNYENENEPIKEKKNEFIILEEIDDNKQINDNPIKISRYHYRHDKNRKIKESKKNKNINDINYTFPNGITKLTENINNIDEKNDIIERKIYHKKYRDNIQKNNINKNNFVGSDNMTIYYSKNKKE